MKITVLGAGAWGTAFGQVLADAGNDVTMWAIEPEIVEGIRDRHHNAVRLPSVERLPENMTATGDRAIFDMAKNLVTLAGNVVLTQGDNVVRGDRLVVDLTTKRGRVEGGRVQTLITPAGAPPKP